MFSSSVTGNGGRPEWPTRLPRRTQVTTQDRGSLAEIHLLQVDQLAATMAHEAVLTEMGVDLYVDPFARACLTGGPLVSVRCSRRRRALGALLTIDPVAGAST
jgi:hypothetical protein